MLPSESAVFLQVVDVRLRELDFPIVRAVHHQHLALRLRRTVCIREWLAIAICDGFWTQSAHDDFISQRMCVGIVRLSSCGSRQEEGLRFARG